LSLFVTDHTAFSADTLSYLT